MDYTFLNVCGEDKYVDSINFISNDPKMNGAIHDDLREITCKEYYHLKKQRVRLNSRMAADGNLEHIFKRSRASFLDSSRS